MRKAVVVDLDGTLVNINTFKVYIEYVCKVALGKGRLDICAQLIWNVLLRKSRWISHEVMKYHILCATDRFMTQKRLDILVDRLLLNVNPDVINLCYKYRKEGYFILLSTAAPESYASIISERLFLDGVCATAIPKKREEWKENVRETKCESTINYLKDRDSSLYVLITDHYDDLPLLDINKERNILVKPNIKTIEHINNNGIPHDILK